MDFPIIEDLTPEQLRLVNSATKYPSINTFHVMGERGRLTEERSVEFDGEVQVSEKVDGTNARIIIPPFGAGLSFVGSREELLTYASDLVFNPQMGIVETVRPFLEQAEQIEIPDEVPTDGDDIAVIFGEVFGKGVGGQFKNYSTRATGFRVFDVALVSKDIFGMSVEQVARWRDRGGQRWLTLEQREMVIDQVDGLEMVPGFHADPPPQGVGETQDWLKAVIPSSLSKLDDSGRGDAEGVVVRTDDRSKIAKIRFEDYNRTLR